MAKTEPDWAAIEVPYRAGMISIRAIGRSFGVSQPAITKHARKHSWKRNDLAARTQKATQRRLAHNASQANSDNQSAIDNQRDNREDQGKREHQGEGSRANSREADVSLARAHEAGLNDAAIVAAASRLQADVITAHRKDMAKAAELCKRLLAELSANTEHIEVIEQGLADLIADDRTEARHTTLMRAVSHTTRSQAMNTLTSALERLVKMERQAFGIDAEDAGKDKAPKLEERLKQYSRERAIDGSGGRVVEIGGKLPRPPGDRLL